jgi:large repetitive protein
LSLSSNGTLSGTPTAGGTFTFTVSATDSSATPFTQGQTYTLTVLAPAFVFSPSTLTASTQVGVPFSQSFSVSGGTAPYKNFSVGTGSSSAPYNTLPAGLTLSPNGILSGTPTASGTFTFTVSATDSSTGSGPYTESQPYTLVVNAPTLVISPSSPLLEGQVGTGYTEQFTVSGGTAPYTNFIVVSGALPLGMTLNPSTGLLSGTPTEGGTFNFILEATDSTSLPGSYSQNAAFTWTVAPPAIVVSPSPSTAGQTVSLVAGQDDEFYNQTFSASGGVGPYSYAISGGALPAGMTLSSNGALSGVPTAGGFFNFTVEATDTGSLSNTGSGNYTASQTYSLFLAAPTITLTTTSLPAGQVGVSYETTLAASGGTAPYSNFIVLSGTLPAGLTLSTNGTISGTPTANGTFNFTVQVSDSSSGAGPFTGSANCTLTVTGQAVVLTLSPGTLPTAATGVAYSQKFTASGGKAPYQNFSITSGALPTGLTLNPSTGVLSGTPTASGTFFFTVQASDSSASPGPYTGSQNYAMTVNVAPTLVVTAPTTLTALAGDAFTQAIHVSGGKAPYHFALSSGSLPAGFTLNTTTGVVGGTAKVAGTYHFTVKVTDSGVGAAQASSSVSFALTVLPGAVAKVELLSQPVSVYVNSTEVPVEVLLLDAYGNRVNGVATLSLAPLSGSPAGVFKAGSVTQLTAVNGVATFNNFAIATIGRYELVIRSGTSYVISTAFYSVAPSTGRQD